MGSTVKWVFRVLETIDTNVTLYTGPWPSLCQDDLSVLCHPYVDISKRADILIPKLLLTRIALVLSTNSGSFPSNSHVSATFSFWIRSGKFWNLGISNKLWDIEFWRKGPILINLCGKTDVRNCDLSQRDFFARYRTVLGVAKGFFLVCSKTWGKMRSQNVMILFPWETCF